MKSDRIVLRAAFAFAAIFVAGCSTVQRPDFTATQSQIAEVPGFPNVRLWGDASYSEFENAHLTPTIRKGETLRFLAISGGGSAGAYGAGIINGWSISGTRPIFNVVSGVSTGALIAPFAFLGPDYDKDLAYVYTSGIANNVGTRKSLAAGLLGSSLLDPGPLRKLVERFVDRNMLDAIAAADSKGRRLLVLTTNIDAQRPVVWDMGKIAASRQPGALQLFRDVLVASASIPAAFPPVSIAARGYGKTFREMHSDGGAAIQVFAVPEGVLAAASPKLLPGVTKAEIYMIVNNTLVPEFQIVRNSTFSIGSRGLSTLLKAQARSSVIANYGFAKQAGMTFNLSTIDKQVPYDPLDPFNLEYMRTLYKFGYERAVTGDAWRHDLVKDLSLPVAPRRGTALAFVP